MSQDSKYKEIQDLVDANVSVLQQFQVDIGRWFDGSYDTAEESALRKSINQSVKRVKTIVMKAGCLKTVTLAPPPAIGGLMIKNADPFDAVLESYYGQSMIPMISDMIDETIGVLKSPEYVSTLAKDSGESREANTAIQMHAKAIARVLQICKRFHLVAMQIRHRYKGRATLGVEDEYDVQDLLGALLKLDFDDVRPEEWTPSYAGKSARVDFLLKAESIVIEVKKTRATLGKKEIGDQLLIDIGRYRVHPGCRSLICFVYDPELRIGNPAELESDLTEARDQLDVRVVVGPKGQ